MGNRASSPKPDDEANGLDADVRAANEQINTDTSSSSSSSPGNDTDTPGAIVPRRRLPLIGAQIYPFALVKNSGFFSGIASATFITIIDTKALCRKMAGWARQKSKEVTQWMRKNPMKTTLTGMLVLSTIFGAAVPAMLGAVGFSAAGPVAGTIAAGWQASIGSVAAGSLFAVLQSAAMGGFGVAIVSLGGAGISFVSLAGVVALVRRVWRRDDDDERGNRGDDGDEDDDEDDRDSEGFPIKGGGDGGGDGSEGANAPAEMYADDYA